MKVLTFILSLTIFVVRGQSEIKVTIPDNKSHSIESIVQSLKGDGLIIRNITTNQQIGSNQLAQFNDQKQTIGMSEGLLLSTGSVLNLGSANLFSGMTGQVTSVPVATYDTIVKQVPCGGKTSNINAVNESPDIVASYEVIQVENLTFPNSYDYDNIDTISFLPSQDVETIQQMNDGKTCVSTIILPKGQQFTPHPGDPDLENELGGGYRTFDACVIEADIIPLGDTLSFRYLFGSEEYDEYVCSPFNDAFAFFISGPGIEGKENMAVLPSGARVTVNSINNGHPYNKGCQSTNPSFYNKNKGQIPLEYDGFTRTLEIVQKVQPFKVYHLKIVIADASDGIYDSGVFVESSSILSYNNRFIIPFSSNHSMLTDETKAILQAMSSIAKGEEGYVLEISGHTDDFGSESFNYNLAQERINSVVSFILDQGFSDEILRTVNKGETMPVSSNLTAEGRAKNRRVEIKLIPTYQVQKEKVSEDVELINYPNPVSDYTTIEVKVANDIEEGEILIFAMGGERVMSAPLLNNKAKVDLSELAPGIYTYSFVVNGLIISSKRLIVVR